MAASDIGKGQSKLSKMQKCWKKDSGWVKETLGNLQTGMCAWHFVEMQHYFFLAVV